MFDAKNENAIEQGNSNLHRKTTDGSGSLVANVDSDMGVEHQVSYYARGYMAKVFGQSICDDIERYMKDLGLSTSNICQEPEAFSEALKVLFGEGADMIINGIIDEASAAFGFESDESFACLDSRYGLERLKGLCKASANKQNGGAA